MKATIFEKIYLSELPKVGKIIDFYSESLLFTLQFLNEDYSGFNVWYKTKVLPGLNSNNREIITYLYKNEIAAVSILKKTDSEKKISTIRVMPKYSNLGLGKTIILDAINYLQCDYPSITIPEKKIFQFTRLMKHFNFQLSNKDNFYRRSNNMEFYFNYY